MSSTERPAPPTRYDVDLADTESVAEWIVSEGGLKSSPTWAGELEGMRGGLRRRLFRRNGMALDELADLIAKTGRMQARQATNAIIGALTHYRTRSKAAGDGTPDVERQLKRLRAAVDAYTWSKRSEWEDRAVLRVHLDTAEQQGSLAHDLGVRAVAKAAGLSTGAVSRAHRRLAVAGWLTQAQSVGMWLQPTVPGLPAATGRRSTWVLSIPPGATTSEHFTPKGSRSEPVAGPGLRRRRLSIMPPDPDAARWWQNAYRGPTMAQRTIWAALSPTRLTPTVALAKKLKRTRRTVERHLGRLAAVGLAIRSPQGKGWKRTPADPAKVSTCPSCGRPCESVTHGRCCRCYGLPDDLGPCRLCRASRP
jgi:biotin operon repressor